MKDRQQNASSIGSITVVLIGAGAVIPWGAASTTDITKKLCLDTTFRTLSGMSVGAWLCEKLRLHYYLKPETVNFETIINAIEYLATFYHSQQEHNIHSNVIPVFFSQKSDLNEILSFGEIYTQLNFGTIAFKKHSKNSVVFEQMVENVRYQASHKKKTFSWHSEYDFFQQLHRHFINLVIEEIGKYEKPSRITKNKKLNKSAVEFLETQSNSLRCYTTNYDRIFPLLLENTLFEGFNSDGTFDAKTVLTDESRNVYYNLHGSVHYDFAFPDCVKLDSKRYFYNFGSGASNTEDQDKRILLHSNIITGLNKSSRILTNPYLQFYHRFFQDCLSANKIFIIGYSFGDAHINYAIRNASEINRNLKIIFISYDSDIAEYSKDGWIPLRKRKEISSNADKIKNQILSHVNKQMLSGIYIKGFDGFLTKKQWKSCLCK
jgi:hypothetical protein